MSVLIRGKVLTTNIKEKFLAWRDKFSLYRTSSWLGSDAHFSEQLGWLASVVTTEMISSPRHLTAPASTNFTAGHKAVSIGC